MYGWGDYGVPIILLKCSMDWARWDENNCEDDLSVNFLDFIMRKKLSNQRFFPLKLTLNPMGFISNLKQLLVLKFKKIFY